MPTADPPAVNQTASRSSPSRWEAPLVRWLLLSLPVVTIAVVALAVFVVGAPRSYRGVRLWGGPTVGQSAVSARLMAVERFYDMERSLGGLPIEVEARAAGRAIGQFRGTTDSAGFLEVQLPLAQAASADLELRVTSRGARLGAGSVALTRARWTSGVRRRGSWIMGAKSGALRIRVHPGRGVFAVPFSDPVWIEVTTREGPAAGVQLRVRAEGTSEAAGGRDLTTDSQGLARLMLTPREHVVALGVEASLGEHRARWYSSLPVVPGALHARREGRQLSIASPVPREAAFYSIVGENGRVAGGRVRLADDGRGGAWAKVDLPQGLPTPAWAVVASEPDMNTIAAVGWPIDGAGPMSTFDARDDLLLDGLPQAYAASLERPQRARVLAGIFAVLALGLAVVLFTGRVRAADRALATHLSETAEGDVERFRVRQSVLGLVTAALCIALGFVLVGLVSLARPG